MAADELKPIERPIRTDIVVAGGGTAGCAAAVAAARRGCKVLLLEESNCLGGTSTTGGVCEWFASTDGLGNVFDRVREELGRFGATSGRFFNSEYLKIVWQCLAEDAGVRLLLHASATGAEAASGIVRRATAVACSRPIEVEARYVIDATGEGDLAAAAGAEFHKGDPVTGRTLHMTLTATLFDTGKPVTPHLLGGLEPIQGPQDLPGLGAGTRLFDGRVYLNATKVMGLDPTDPFNVTAAECLARRQLVRVVHWLQRTKYPTYALASSGAGIGIREGRRIVGDYVLTEQDIRTGRPHDFADGVAVATSQIDFHSLTKSGNTGWRERVEPYAIPLRCLVVRGFRNLLVAGKCISGDQVAHSSYRMTPTCCAMGQAAGTAAAMAVEKNAADIREVDVNELRAALAAAGMELDPRKHKAFAPQVTPRKENAR